MGKGKNFASIDVMRMTLFAFLFVLVLTLWVPATYAMDILEKVRWKLIYLSPYSGCTNYQYQMANAYDEITSKYFDLYKFVNSKYPVQCMPDKEYSHYQIPDDLDLLILIYDKEIGKKELQTNDVGGLYNHAGTDRTKNHTIIVCDCSNFGFSDPTWILSHELSHFITYYLGFDLSVVEDKIHSLDAKYDQCIEGVRDSTCSQVKTHVYGDYYFTAATVMTPYQPAIGKKLIPTENDKTQSDVSNNAANSQVVMNMQKEITKWWYAGKISNDEYAKVLGYMVGKSGGTINGDKLPNNVVLLDGPDGKKGNATYYDLGTGKLQMTSGLLKRVPLKAQNTAADSSDKVQIPQWFKSRAHWWSENRFWNDKEFVSGIKYLFHIGTGN